MTQMIGKMGLRLPTVAACRKRLDTWALPIGVAIVIGLSIYAFIFSG